jgi:elongation factor Ts
VLVHARGDGDGDQAYRLAMHIAASKPLYVRRADVPPAEIDAEREILSKQPDVQEKPMEVREKIVEGRIQKWLKEIVLEEQPWIHDTNRRVGDVLDEAELEVVEFKRLAVAE